MYHFDLLFYLGCIIRSVNKMIHIKITGKTLVDVSINYNGTIIDVQSYTTVQWIIHKSDKIPENVYEQLPCLTNGRN